MLYVSMKCLLLILNDIDAKIKITKIVKHKFLYIMRNLKLFKFIFCFSLSLLTGSGVAMAQNNYDAFNRRLAEEHCRDYMDKADDYYRQGKYRDAEYYYKESRKESRRYNGNYFSDKYYNDKLDKCEYAIRNGKTREQADDEATDALADALVELFSGGKSKNNSSSNSSSSNRSSSNNNNENATLQEVNYRGMHYSTLSTNKSTRILRVDCYDTQTIVELEYTNLTNGTQYLTINRDTYIKDRTSNSSRKIQLQRTEEIPYAGSSNKRSVQAGDSHVFRLYFGALPESCQEIDLVEPDKSIWKFYHIEL